jgi:hypothetical protein
MKALALSLILLSFAYTLPHGSKCKKIEKDRDTVCYHGYADYLLKNVPSKLDKCVIDKELQHSDYFIFCVATYACRLVLDKMNKIVPHDYKLITLLIIVNYFFRKSKYLDLLIFRIKNKN